MQVKISQATSMITSFIMAKLVPMLKGSPGCGKSQIVHQIADHYGLKVIDLRLSQCDPTDLLGFPDITRNANRPKAGYVPMDSFPIEGDPIPDGYNGWLLFLDEMNAASNAVQAAAYKIVLDRMVGLYHLHKNVAIVCAGNLETDNAIVQPMSTALQSRLVHLELVVDHKEWIDWANSNNIDHRITAYINFKPGNIYTFQADHTDDTYACPRTWAFADKILKTVKAEDPDLLPMLAGTISEGVAREFIGFCKNYKDLYTPNQIKREAATLKVPDEPSVLYALTGMMAHHADEDNIEQFIVFIKRLPIEFQVVCLRETTRRNVALRTNEHIRKWVSTTACDLF